MRKAVVTALLFAFCTFTSGQDQRKPNLSGTWRLTQSERVGRLPGHTDHFEKTLVIAHQDPEIRIATHIKDDGVDKSLEQMFFSDGRGETNPTFRENQTLKSKTKWKDHKLEVHSIDTLSVQVPSGNKIVLKLEIAMKWELSKDGNTLTTINFVFGPPGVQMKNSQGNGPAKEIFSRVK